MHTQSKFSVFVNGVLKTSINPNFVRRQNISDETLKKIVDLHVQRILLEESFVSPTNTMTGEEYHEQWTKNQCDLQNLWGFGVDYNYHMFWRMSGCDCPKLDNQDNYPSGPYYFNSSCKVHGFMLAGSTKFKVNEVIRDE